MIELTNSCHPDSSFRVGRDPPAKAITSRALKQRIFVLAYLGGITLAAGGAVFYWLRACPEPVTPAAALVALFVLLAVIAEHFPLPIGPQRKVDATIAVYFASLLLFGAAVAVVLVGLAQLLGQVTLAMRRNPST